MPWRRRWEKKTLIPNTENIKRGKEQFAECSDAFLLHTTAVFEADGSGFSDTSAGGLRLESPPSVCKTICPYLPYNNIL
jgi:hypothetical protein